MILMATSCLIPPELEEDSEVLFHELSAKLIRLTSYDHPLQKLFKKYLVGRMLEMHANLVRIPQGCGCLIEIDSLCDS